MGSFYPKMIEFSGTEEEQCIKLEESIKNWTIVMNDIDYRQAEMAVMKLVRFNPYDRIKVADIINQVKEMNDEMPCAEEAWGEVCRKLDPYKAPKWSHKIIQDAIRTMGYSQLCMSENPSIDRAQFFKIYNTLKDRKADKAENELVLLIAKQMPNLLK